MAKSRSGTKTKSRHSGSGSGSGKNVLRGTNSPLVKTTVPQKPTKPIEELLTEASELLESSQPEIALPLVQEALSRLEANKQDYKDIDTLLRLAAQEKPTFPTALVLGADICFALGDVAEAVAQYELAIKLDPDGQLVSAEPWLQLAQLCEEGGKRSIEYFDKAIEVMKNEIDVLDGEESMAVDETRAIVDGRRQKVAEALCGMAEVYMTDLSWEKDAEQRCEKLVTEAIATCPEYLSAGVLQTLASMRISQERIEEAKRVLTQSLDIWKDVQADEEDQRRPDFATRISLVRLLLEVEQESEAMVILDGLITEEDQSVESWYLGGWCHLLLQQKGLSTEDGKPNHAEQARLWLTTCLKLYKTLGYEDEPLRQHAEELIIQLNKILELDHENGEWEDTDDEEQEDVDSEDVEIEADDVEHKTDGDVEMT